MSFYGNISNAGRTNLTFDKIYPNRESMETNAQIDGVFVGRHILIEYDDNASSRRIGYLTEDAKTNLYAGIIQQPLVIYQDDTCEHPFIYDPQKKDRLYGLELGDIIEVSLPWTDNLIVRFYFICGMSVKDENGNEQIYPEYNGMAAFDFLEMGTSERSDYALNYIIDKNWADKNGFRTEFEEAQTWDSTIWQKTVIDGRYVYQMIGSLNSKSPRFTIEADAPTLNPISPHFDQNSNNQNYILHLQPNWGLKIKQAKEELDENGNIIKVYSDQKVEYNNQFYNPDAKNPDGTTGNIEYNEDENAPANENYDGAIYFNKAGFISRVRTKELELPTEVSILPTGISGKPYVNHAENIADGSQLIPQPDIQEITMHLPVIGNTISDLWDLVYGEYELDENGDFIYETDKDGNILYEIDANGEFILDDNEQKIPIIKFKTKRNLDIDWNSLQGTRLVTEGESGFDYNEKRTQTIAGAINSVHDLMGMIINVADTDEEGNFNLALGEADTDHIYYGGFKMGDSVGSKSFYIKDRLNTYYPYVPENESDLNAFYDEYYYPVLTEFQKDKYHIKINNNYYSESADTPTKNTNYYDLSKINITPIKLISWIPVEKPKDEEEKPIGPFPDYSGTVLNHYYKDINNDYIRDYNNKADPNKTYYTLNVDQQTYPNVEGYEDNLKLLYNPIPRVRNYDGSYKGFLYFIKKPDSEEFYEQVYELISQKVEVDEDGKAYLVYKQARDENNNLIYDEDGNPVYEQMKDQYGNLIYDEKGEPVYEPLWDEPKEYREDAVYYFVEKYFIENTTSTTTGLTQTLIHENGSPLNADNRPDNETIVHFLPLTRELFDSEGNPTGEFETIPYYYNMKDIYKTDDNGDFVLDEQGNKIFEKYELTNNFYLLDNEEIDNNKIYYLVDAIKENGILDVEIEKPVDSNTNNSESDESDAPETEDSNEPETEIIQVNTQYYVKNKYYYQPTGSNNYIFGREDNVVKDVQYFIFPSSDIIKAEDITFYQPGKYYYSKVDADGNIVEILDYETSMRTKDNPNLLPNEEILFDTKTNRVHYLRNELYVIEDTSGILAQGSVWNSGWPIPETITLGKLYKGEEIIQEFNQNGELVDRKLNQQERDERQFVWRELKGFSRSLNTINGLILRLNQVYKFDDKLTRDRETIQGCLNTLNDLINDFSELIPGQIGVIDEYGRLKSAQLFTNISDETDAQGWISVSVDDSATDTKITFRHEDAKIGDDIEVQEDTTITPKFGESFDTITSLNVDAKGHVYTGTRHTIQLPKGSLEKEESVDNANVLTDLTFEPEIGALKYKYQNVGNLKLTGYEAVADLGLTGGQASITADNVINDAINKLDQFTANEAKALDQEIENRIADVNTEQERAELAETTLQNNLNSEIERAKKAESDLNTKIDLVFDDKDISDLDSVVDLINWTTEHGKTVEEILSSINDNKEAIESNDADILKLQNDLSTTNTNLNNVNTTLDNKINEVNNTLTGNINNVNTTLTNNINTVESNLSSSIGNNKDAIDALKLLVGEKSVNTQIGEAIAAENLDQYATDTELNALNERVVNLENNTYQSQIDTLNATIESLQKIIEDLNTRIKALEDLNTPTEPTEPSQPEATE